ncbi:MULTISPECIES: TrkH family potassium uptake protein [Enterococcus]|uniref:Trk system potassium uptake protein n=1 Tax=Enterococcus diestrammenae TaxID=1155073 RepID=A0ABV0EXB6_9ENTE|nr:TrkH family potassium uptake protein [Enterococcus diestrammenae]KAF1295912.1 potassium transporter KefA [Enterococcus diestrammenae]
MNKKMIVYLLGKILQAEGLMLLLPTLVAVIYQESLVASYGGLACLLLVMGGLISLKAPKDKGIFIKEGLFIVGVSWVLLSFFGAVPLVVSGEMPHFADAFFEVVSGFTTTGATVLSDIDALSHASLFWRSFTHWVGGMGILVFTVAFIPVASGRTMHILKAEMPGPIVGKLVSKTRVAARILYLLYGALTLLEVLFLLLGGMPFFDSLLNTFATAGTGGFTMSNAGIIGYHSPYLEGVLTVFMILFGVNFNLLFLVISGKGLLALKNEELRWYLGIIAVAIALLTVNLMSVYDSVTTAFRYGAFQVASIITTTGFVTADYDQWPMFSQTVLLLLMFVGASAGSTGGGMKVSRLVMVVKSGVKEIKRMLHPHGVITVDFEGAPVSRKTLNNMHSYFILYALVFCSALLVISLENLDFHTTFSAVATTINNVGPGFNGVGPMQNFGGLRDLSKYTLSFTMLAGRLEIFPVLLLFSKYFWKE